ncbi:MAG: hydroxylamine reductase, partial [Eubacteriaceae bacterium]|nr:hydroxylamine reductase [Eubacteriaceae bacterium]
MSMFCFQCKQTAKGTGCTIGGVCGKKVDTANLLDAMTGKLVALAIAVNGKNTAKTDELMIDGLFTAITNVNFNDESIAKLEIKIDAEIKKYGDYKETDMKAIWDGDEDIRSLKSLILFGLRGMAAYAHHAKILGKSDKNVNAFFYKAMAAIGQEHTADELLALVIELGNVNLACMALLDDANTSTYGHPVPVKVTTNIEKGPFIVVTGHDLKDLELLLKQTEGKGINIYTHGEMLPAHGYPELKKYAHLIGNFGTAWQNQQKEFDNIPG